MSPAPPAVFVVTVRAVAGPESADADGRAYAILAFVAAEAEPEAELAARQDLEAQGWVDIQIERIGEITDEAAVPEDFARAMQTARRWGCALIIYDEP